MRCPHTTTARWRMKPGTAYVGHTGWSAGHHAEHWPARHGLVSRFQPFLSPAVSSTVPPVAAGASGDHQDGDTARWGGRQRRAGEGTTRPDFVLAQPPSSAWGIARRPPSRRVPGDDDVGSLQPASRRHQSPQECHRDGEGRVRHDPEGAPRKPEIECVGHDHGDILCPEPFPELGRTPVMPFDGDDPCAPVHQGCRERAAARSHVEDQVTGSNLGVGDDAGRPGPTELVEPPSCPYRGHGAPSRNWSWAQA